MAGFLGLMAAIIHLQIMFKKHDELYFYFNDKKWRNILVSVAKNYDQRLERLFFFNKGKLVVTLMSALFSSVLSLLIIIVWRIGSTGSLMSAISSLFSSMWVIVLIWILSASIVGVFSVFITKYFVKKAANCLDGKGIIKFIALDLFISYLLVAVSMYICLLGTLPALTWSNASFNAAKDTFFILLPFAHENALTWPTHGVVELDGLSASIISIATVIPSIAFVFTIILSLMLSVILKFISPIAMDTIDWFTEQNTAKTTWYITSFCVLGGALAGIGKVLELIE